ncbi:MAG: WD40/YVTN/BNR-like repeat-containing protein, partial [Candidatus Promineifilaceae bacterium]
LRSDDGGATWALAPGSDGQPRFGRPEAGHVHPDVHSVNGHPSSADIVYAPTGGGFYLSADGGANWELRYADCYCRAVWADPTDPDHLLLSPANDVERNGRIEESFDAGRSWAEIHTGLEAPWPRALVERFYPVEDALFAVLSDGRVFAAEIGAWEWRPLFGDLKGVRALAPAV